MRFPDGLTLLLRVRTEINDTSVQHTEDEAEMDVAVEAVVDMEIEIAVEDIIMMEAEVPEAVDVMTLVVDVQMVEEVEADETNKVECLYLILYSKRLVLNIKLCYFAVEIRWKGKPKELEVIIQGHRELEVIIQGHRDK